MRSLQLPTMVLSDATYVLDRSPQLPITVVAEEISLYDNPKRATLKNLSFTQYDAKGVLELSGSADLASVDLGTYDAELTGSVRVEKADAHLVIEADQIQWIQDQEKLLSNPDSIVQLTFEGNKRVKGTSLVVELSTSTVSFKEVEQGVIDL